VELAAKKARLLAERDGQREVSFPQALLHQGAEVLVDSEEYLACRDRLPIAHEDLADHAAVAVLHGLGSLIDGDGSGSEDRAAEIAGHGKPSTPQNRRRADPRGTRYRERTTGGTRRQEGAAPGGARRAARSQLPASPASEFELLALAVAAGEVAPEQPDFALQDRLHLGALVKHQERRTGRPHHRARQAIDPRREAALREFPLPADHPRQTPPGRRAASLLASRCFVRPAISSAICPIWSSSCWRWLSRLARLLAAKKARLLAERDGQREVSFPQALLHQGAEVQSILERVVDSEEYLACRDRLPIAHEDLADHAAVAVLHGVVGEILVRDGQPVTASQVLLRIDDAQTRAELALRSVVAAQPPTPPTSAAPKMNPATMRGPTENATFVRDCGSCRRRGRGIRSDLDHDEAYETTVVLDGEHLLRFTVGPLPEPPTFHT
jgi:hypothetical protein